MWTIVVPADGNDYRVDLAVAARGAWETVTRIKNGDFEPKTDDTT